MGLATAATNILGGSFIGSIDSLLDNLITNDEERAEAKLKLLALEQSGQLEALRQSLSAIMAEAQSEDKWTSRARPSFLYIIYFLILACFVGGVAGGIVGPEKALQVADTVGALLNAIPESLWWLFGAGYLGYTGGRSMDKWTKAKGGKP